jgi:predicted RecA/RadA family phage recombinase
MSLEARPVHVFQTEEALAPANLVPGEVVQLADGRAAVFIGNTNIASGQLGSFATRGDFEFRTASATTLSAGANAQWNNSTNLVVASGGTFRIGIVKFAKLSGQTITRIALNELALPAV